MDKTYLKKTIPLCAGILTAALGLSSCGSSAYKQYADNPAKQVASILRDNQCLACHAVDAPVPFYASVPIAGPMVTMGIQNRNVSILSFSIFQSLPKYISQNRKKGFLRGAFLDIPEPEQRGESQ